MLSFADERWATFRAGYRVPVDLRPLLSQLETTTEPAAVWPKLWEELYHQGDIGEGSLVAVPHLVRIHKQRAIADWNTYGLVSHIELVRGMNGNPDVPSWERASYVAAIDELARCGTSDLAHTSDEDTVVMILAVVAIAHGARAHGRVLANYSADEVDELTRSMLGPLSPSDAG